MQQYLNRKKQKNNEYKQFLNNEVETKPLDWKIQENKLNLKDKIREAKRKQNDENLRDVESKINPQIQLTNIGRLKAAVLSVVACLRMHNSQNFNYYEYRSKAIENFVNYYESLDNQLRQYVFNSIRIPYMSVLNFPEIKMDLTENNQNLYKGVSNDIRDKYIKLEIRLKGIIDNLISAANVDQIDPNLLAFLNLIVQNKAIVPKRFFCSFEYARLLTSNTELRLSCK